jgi:hypothetical protein
VPTTQIDQTHHVSEKQSLPAVNETVEKIVLKALAKKRELRYASAGDLGRDVARYLAGQRTAAPRQQPGAALLPKRRVGLIIGIAGACMVVIAAAAVLMRGSSRPETQPVAPVESAKTSVPEPHPPAMVPAAVSPAAAIENTQANAVAPSVPHAMGVRGNLVVLFKGGTLEAFLNGRRIHQSDGDDLRSIPVIVSPGDCIVLRVNSSFYYRSVRCAFIAEDRSDSFPLTASGAVLQPVVDPRSEAPTSLPEASHPAAGVHDEHQQIVWNGGSLPGAAEWIALPQPNTTYDLVFAVPKQ